MPIGYQKEIDNNPQSQTSPVFGYLMMTSDKDDITLQSALAEDALTATLSSGHGFTGVDGEHILVYENDHFIQSEVNVGDISGDVITLKTPVDNAFTTGAKVVRGNIDFQKDFSGANAKVIAFEILDGEIPIDITSIILTFESSADPDDGTFGGIAELSNGQYFRQIDGRRINLGNYKKNLDFAKRRGEIKYTQKAAGKNYATIITFDIELVFGQALRIDPRKNCSLMTYLRDDLSSLLLYNISLAGSYTEGE
jgi:hypothetical protein